MKEHDAVLKNWRFNGSGEYLIGEIYNDKRGRFADGGLIYTSKLKKVNFEKGFAVTQNTRYKLKD